MKRVISKIILHCSASDVDGITAHDVDRWHKEKGWDGIGYHWFIRRDGQIEPGRTEDKVGAHCEGENSHSIGICVHGDKRFEEVQMNSLKRLVAERCHTLLIPEWEIYPHHHFNPHKTCPNFDIEFVKEYVRNKLFSNGRT